MEFGTNCGWSLSLRNVSSKTNTNRPSLNRALAPMSAARHAGRSLCSTILFNWSAVTVGRWLGGAGHVAVRRYVRGTCDSACSAQEVRPATVTRHTARARGRWRGWRCRCRSGAEAAPVPEGASRAAPLRATHLRPFVARVPGFQVGWTA